MGVSLYIKNPTLPISPIPIWSTHSYKTTDELTSPVIVSKYRDIMPITRAVGALIFVQSESAYYRLNENEREI